VTASPRTLDLAAAASQTFTLGFEAPGSTIVKLKENMAIGWRTASTGWIDYAGMSGHAGSGTFTPTDVGVCLDKPSTVKTDTFQLQDDLDQVSDPRSLDTPIVYSTACPCQPVGCTLGCLTQATTDGCGHPIDCGCPQSGCNGTNACGPGGACVCIPP
jgi:hypothetical protein